MSGVLQNDVNRHEDPRNERPHAQQIQPSDVTKRRSMNIRLRRHMSDALPSLPDERRRYDVLNADAGVRARHANEQRQIFGYESNADGWQESEKRKNDSINDKWIGLAWTIEKRLQVIPQRYGDYRKVRRQDEDGKQTKEIGGKGACYVNCKRIGELVFDQTRIEGEDNGKRYESVEDEDADKGEKEKDGKTTFRSNRGDDGGKGVLAHEGVDQHAE